MKTLKNLKNDLSKKKISIELIERFGNNDISKFPKHLQGKRIIESTNTCSCTFKHKNGTDKSYLNYPPTSLMDYTDDFLIIYKPGERDLNDEELAIKKEHDMKESEYYEKNPFGNYYYQEKYFYKNSKAPWLAGELIRGKYYNVNANKILDNSIRGERELVYLIHHEDEDVEKVAITKDTSDMIKNILSLTCEEAYYKYGFCRDENLITLTLHFKNGYEMDIKLCNGDETSTAWTEAVLFDENGSEISCTDVSDDFEGFWKLEYNNVNYVAKVCVY